MSSAEGKCYPDKYNPWCYNPFGRWNNASGGRIYISYLRPDSTKVQKKQKRLLNMRNK